MKFARSLVPATAALCAALLAPSLHAAEPARRIEVYVQPYYASADKPGGQPAVQVGQAFDALLASNDAADIRKARDLIEASPDVVTPMTLMVLAIRFYDVGLRDDAVFWFYVAKDRYLTLSAVVDDPAIGGAKEAIVGFATLAGPYINSYAFCDPDKQSAANAKALAWVEAHPYQAIFMQRFHAKPGDRAAYLAKSIESLKAAAEKSAAQNRDPEFLKTLRARRAEAAVDEQFCWK